MSLHRHACRGFEAYLWLAFSMEVGWEGTRSVHDSRSSWSQTKMQARGELDVITPSHKMSQSKSHLRVAIGLGYGGSFTHVRVGEW